MQGISNIEYLNFSESKTVKEAIISILSAKWPLSLKEIYSQVKKTHNFPVTYQAVHKSITALEDRGIITKEDRAYLINKEWIKSLVDYSAKLETTYLKIAPVLKNGIPEKITASDVYSMYLLFLESFMDHTFDKGSEQPICFKGFYSWNPMVFNEREISRLKIMTETNRIFVITESNNAFDKISSRMWEDHGIRFINGIPGCVTDSDVCIVGDYIINIYYPDDLFSDFKILYEKVKNAEDINWMDFNKKFFYRKTEIKLLISHDKEVASLMRKNILKHFPEFK